MREARQFNSFHPLRLPVSHTLCSPSLLLCISKFSSAHIPSPSSFLPHLSSAPCFSSSAPPSLRRSIRVLLVSSISVNYSGFFGFFFPWASFPACESAPITHNKVSIHSSQRSHFCSRAKTTAAAPLTQPGRTGLPNPPLTALMPERATEVTRGGRPPPPLGPLLRLWLQEAAAQLESGQCQTSFYLSGTRRKDWRQQAVPLPSGLAVRVG